MIRRLGQRWNRLHKAVYALAVLALFHYFLQTKINVTQPVLMTGYFLWLMGFRLILRGRRTLGPLHLAALALAAGLGTAIVEAAWYGLATGVPAGRVLGANLTLAMGVRPAWWVLGSGLIVALLQVTMGLFRARPEPRPGRSVSEPLGGR
jgi:sulfoxide reductase heme-binding subunit YedZ